MNKFKSIISVVATILVAGSCSTDRFLDEQPPLVIPLETAITNENQLKVAVNGLYNSMQNTATYGGAIPTLSELLADQSFVSIKNSNRFALTRQSTLTFYTPNNGDTGGIWAGLYSTIMNANIILANEGKISDDSAVDSTPAEYFAQAYATRAMCYFDLITFFAQYPGGGNQNLGVPLPTQVSFGSALPRSSVSEVYALILADLKKAEASLSSSTQRKVLTKSAVNMLLSRYYLAMKDYTNADAYAQKVLDDTNSTLLPSAQVANYWLVGGETNAETIFQIDYNSLDLPGSNDAIIATWYSGGTYKQNFATETFYNSLAANDIRKTRWYTNVGTGVDLSTYPDTPKPIDVAKYRTIDRDVVVIRKTEAVFNQIEALYHTNPTLALSKLIAWVSTYRQPAYTFSGSGSALLKEILDQKNKEFMLEGFRYRDLKRNGISFTNPQTGVALSPSNFQFNAFPIPQGEMNTNVNMIQNPGY